MKIEFTKYITLQEKTENLRNVLTGKLQTFKLILNTKNQFFKRTVFLYLELI